MDGMDPVNEIQNPGDRVAAWAAGRNMAALALVTFAMTPYTYLIDEIKIAIFLCAGPLLLLAGLAAIGLGQAPLPPRGVTLGLLAWGVVLGVSTLTSRYPWAGWMPCLHFLAGLGFFVSAFCAGASARLTEKYLRFLVLLLLAACVIGFLMFDLTFSGRQHSFLSWVTRRLYPVPGTSVTYNLLSTLSHADNTLQSTILNDHFFSGFCLFLFPFAVLMMLAPGPAHRLRGRLAGVAAALLAALTVAIITTAWLKRISATPTGYMSRDFLRIVWGGAWGIFKDHQILGGGPGTFDIFFSNYRSPDFFRFGISNVTTHAFNMPLEILAETGLFGLLAYLALLGALFVPAFRAIRRGAEPRLRHLVFTSLLALGVFHAVSLFNPFSQWVIGLAPMWCVMGLLAGLNARALPGERRIARHGARVAAAAVGASIILPLSVMAGVNYFRGQMAHAQGLSFLETGNQLMAAGGTEGETLLTYFHEATHHFDRAAGLDRNNLSVYYKAGSAWTSLSQVESQIAEDLRKTNDLEGAGRHEAQAEEGLRRAIENYEALAARSPDYAEINYNLGIVYHMAALNAAKRAERKNDPGLKATAEDYDKRAIEHLLRMVKLSHRPDAALLAGNTLMETGWNARALDLLREASDREPGNTELARKYLEAAQKARNDNAEKQARERLSERP